MVSCGRKKGKEPHGKKSSIGSGQSKKKTQPSRQVSPGSNQSNGGVGSGMSCQLETRLVEESSMEEQCTIETSTECSTTYKNECSVQTVTSNEQQCSQETVQTPVETCTTDIQEVCTTERQRVPTKFVSKSYIRGWGKREASNRDYVEPRKSCKMVKGATTCKNSTESKVQNTCKTVPAQSEKKNVCQEVPHIECTQSPARSCQEVPVKVQRQVSERVCN